MKNSLVLALALISACWLSATRSAAAGLEAIHTLKPDLVFLDVEMPVMNGFEMLEQIDTIDFSVVFTTSYDQYAIRAIRFSALGALMSERDGSRISDTQVTHVLKILYDLGYSTTEPGADRGGPYRLTRRGSVAAQRVAAAIETWQTFQPPVAQDTGDEAT